MSTATDELISAYLAELEREAAQLSWNARTELLEDVRSHIEVAVAEIRDAAASGEGGDDSPDEAVRVRAMLAALGEPAEIVAEALADDPKASSSAKPSYSAAESYAGEPHVSEPYVAGPYGAVRNDSAARSRSRQSPPYPLDTADVGAVALLLLGGFLAGIGWVVGVVLLWTSVRWTRAEKLIGTLILPGGIGGGVFAFAWARSGSYGRCENGQCVTVHTGWNPPGWLALGTLAVIVLAPAVTAVFLVNRAHQRPGIAPASRMAFAVIAGFGTVGLLAVVGLVAVTGTQAKTGGSQPAPVEYSGGPVSGYVVPVSSPAQESSSAPYTSSGSGP